MEECSKILLQMTFGNAFGETEHDTNDNVTYCSIWFIG